MSMFTSIRRIVAAFGLASVMGLGLAVGAPTAPVQAHGCGTTDHTVGEGPGWEIHYYEGHYTSGNSRFARWWEVTASSAGYNDTWCGCINPYEPCYNLATSTTDKALR